MRCPSCGIENAPDSRFCGGCGGKLGGSVAPTQKLPDDQAAVVRAQSVPPTLPRAASVPPTRAPSVAPMMSSPSLSMAAAPPNRRGGVIALVLLADLGLAVAGAVMLGKGLGHGKAEAKPDSKPEAKPTEPVKTEAAPPAAPTPASAPAPAPAPAAAAVEPPPPTTAEPAGSDNVAAARKDDKAVKRHEAKPKHAVVKPKQGLVAGPIDPYPVDLAAEVDKQTTRSRPAFARCYGDATTGGALHGSIRVAFQIRPDGIVVHASPVENTTGSDALATCLTVAIAGWTFPAHPGDAVEFVRPFGYP